MPELFRAHRQRTESAPHSKPPVQTWFHMFDKNGNTAQHHVNREWDVLEKLSEAVLFGIERRHIQPILTVLLFTKHGYSWCGLLSVTQNRIEKICVRLSMQWSSG